MRGHLLVRLDLFNQSFQVFLHLSPTTDSLVGEPGLAIKSNLDSDPVCSERLLISGVKQKFSYRAYRNQLWQSVLRFTRNFHHQQCISETLFTEMHEPAAA